MPLKKKTKQPDTPRFFLDCDWNQEWYLVPLSLSKLWDKMTVDDPDDDDEKFFKKWDETFGHFRLGFHPSKYTFSDPKPDRFSYN